MGALIVNVALTGCVAHKADNPNLPVTPEEVAADARRCADEGAQVFHVHARDRHGNPAWGAMLYRRYVDAVRDAVPGAIVSASLSGRHFEDFYARATALEAKPDLATVTLGSVDFVHGSAMYSRSQVEAILRLMLGRGVRPEFEAFDLGHVFRLRELAERLSGPVYVNTILGVALPARWSVYGILWRRHGDGWVAGATAIGRDAWNVQKWAMQHGDHVRVGLEDSLWMEKGVPATNPALVARAVAYARTLGREPATLAEAKEELGL